MTNAPQSPTEWLAVELADRVFSLRLNRPEALNALRPEMLSALASLIDQASAAL